MIYKGELAGYGLKCSCMFSNTMTTKILLHMVPNYL